MTSNFYEVCFIDEILIDLYPTNNLQSVRILGKLKSYNPVTCIGRLADPECKTLQTLAVNLQHIEDVSFLKDSVYQITGEIRNIRGEKLLDASIAKNIDGIDVQMFKEAVNLRFILNPKHNKQKRMPKLKQATISSLKGVVVVEEFLRYKNVLDNPDESDDYKLSALNRLKEKKPAKEIIKNTGIGTTLKTLEKHPNEDIVKEVKKLCDLWELTADAKHQPTIEVRYDKLTLHIRRTSVKLFLKELGGEEEDEKLADVVEKEIFHSYKRLISKNYRKTVRKITFVLRHEKAENEALKHGIISPSNFVKKYLKTA